MTFPRVVISVLYLLFPPKHLGSDSTGIVLTKASGLSATETGSSGLRQK